MSGEIRDVSVKVGGCTVPVSGKLDASQVVAALWHA